MISSLVSSVTVACCSTLKSVTVMMTYREDEQRDEVHFSQWRRESGCRNNKEGDVKRREDVNPLP